jgi:large subunit ribosomal protein L10
MPRDNGIYRLDLFYITRNTVGGEIFKMASETILKQKEEEVKALAEKFKDAKLVLLTDYRGISVADDTALRTEVRKANAEYKIIKNNIVKRALNANGENGLDDKLEGPTAVIMTSEDYLEPTKAIYKFAKENDFYKIKGGIIEGKVMTAEEIITLAKLPSKETLLSMLAGGLLATIQKFAVAIDQVRVQKEAQAE